MLFQLVVTVVAVSILNSARPYVDPLDNALAILSQWVIFAITFLALLIKMSLAASVATVDVESLETATVVIFFIPITIVVVDLVWQILSSGAYRWIVFCVDWEAFWRRHARTYRVLNAGVQLLDEAGLEAHRKQAVERAAAMFMNSKRLGESDAVVVAADADAEANAEADGDKGAPLTAPAGAVSPVFAAEAKAATRHGDSPRAPEAERDLESAAPATATATATTRRAAAPRASRTAAGRSRMPSFVGAAMLTSNVSQPFSRLAPASVMQTVPPAALDVMRGNYEALMRDVADVTAQYESERMAQYAELDDARSRLHVLEAALERTGEELVLAQQHEPQQAQRRS